MRRPRKSGADLTGAHSVSLASDVSAPIRSAPKAQAAVVLLRLQPGAEHLHSLGPRVIAELLAEIGRSHGIMPAILDRLDAYRHRLTPEMVRAAGGHRFPPPPLHVVRSTELAWEETS